MKVRLLTLLAIIFLLGNVSFAQGVGAYKAKRTELVKKKNDVNPERKGFYVMPEFVIGCEIEQGTTNGLIYNVNGIIGYEFNNHFALGAGIGLNNTYKSVIGGDYPKKFIIEIPFYFNINGDFTKRPISNIITPYYDVDLGIITPIKKSSCIRKTDWPQLYPYLNEYYNKGFMISPELGIRVNKCYIGAKLMVMTTHHDLFSGGNIINEDYIGGKLTFSNKYYTASISLKFGYKIPLKNVKL